MRKLATFIALLLAPLIASAHTGVHYDAAGTSGVASGGVVGPGLAVCWLDPGSAQSVCVDSPSAGVLRTYGSGGVNDEDWLCDYEGTADTITCSSATGVLTYVFSGMTLEADGLNFGAYASMSSASADVISFYNAAGTERAALLLNQSGALKVRTPGSSGFGTLYALNLYATGGDFAVDATKYIRLDGAAGTTLISESSTDNINVSLAGISVLDIGNGSGPNAAIIARRGNIRSQLSNGSATVDIERSDGTPNPADNIGEIRFLGYDTTPTADIQYAGIRSIIKDATPGDVDGSIYLRIRNDGSVADVIGCDATDGAEACTFGLPIVVPTYTRELDARLSSANVGATAPSSATIGNRRCLQFNQATTAETAFVEKEVPDDWDGASDWTLQIYTHTVAGDALQNSETIEFTATYRVLGVGDPYDKGTPVSIPVTYTATGGAEADKAETLLTGTIDFDDVNQPLVAGESITVTLDLNEGATSYSGNPYACVAHFEYQSNTLPTH